MHLPEDTGHWDKKALLESVLTIFPVREDIQKFVAGSSSRDDILTKLQTEAERLYAEKEGEIGDETFRQAERAVLLRVTDMLWMEHLDAMVRLREAIGLRGYGQRDPLVEYKQEAYQMFHRLQAAIQGDAARMIFRVRISQPVSGSAGKPEGEEIEEKKRMAMKGAESDSAEATSDAQVNLQGGAEPTGDFKDEAKELKREAKEGISPSRSKPTARHPEFNSGSSSEMLKQVQHDDKGAPRSLDSARDMVRNDGGSGAVRDPSEKKERVGRDDPCPCGATHPDGRPIKYKHCHGK
jgi:preprotein translocase subunit SecA